jgi:hypothetical protein
MAQDEIALAIAVAAIRASKLDRTWERAFSHCS